MKLTLAAALYCLALGAHAQAHKCIGPDGKIQYSDTACPSDAKGTTVRTDRPNSVDTSHSYKLDRTAGAAMECDAARETLRHNDTREAKAAVRRECGPAAAGHLREAKDRSDAAEARQLQKSRAEMQKLLERQYESQKALGRALNR